VKPLDFDYLRDLLKERSGLVLSTEKAYLVESRLMPVARKRGLATTDELIVEIRAKKDAALLVEVTDAMTTNESFFFRDTTPFDSFRDTVLPAILAARRAEGRDQVRIWSAACSSGQEAYSLAMILKENPAKFGAAKYEIIGTDLSTEIVERAEQGSYTQFEVQRGLPIQLLVKYFKQDGDVWRIDPSIRRMVKFRIFNLLESYAVLGRFDIVFCRNVLIYFDQQTKSDILGRIAAMLPPDGVLYLGGAESVLGISDAFKPVKGLRGVYALSSATQTQPAATPQPARQTG
jgi:chemotaxis protein methyltransferase CheR